MTPFERALDFTLGWEIGHNPKNPTGYTNIRDDHGGPTCYGITQRTLDRWREVHPGIADVKDLKRSEAESIYRELYWQPASCDLLGEPSAIAHFDAAVNCGVKGAVKLLQEAAGCQADGIFGPLTLEATLKAEEGKLVGRMLAERREFYHSIVARDASQRRFLRGWLRRVDALAALLAEPTEEIL